MIHQITESQYCYIEFDFTNEENFSALKQTFEILKDSKNNSVERADEFWLATFPEYALVKFKFLDSDLKPDFVTNKETESTWHFYSLIELLSINYEIEYIDLKKTDTTKGILIYDAYSYPYGGIEGLLVFLKSFNCEPRIYDDGTGVYNYPQHKVIQKDEARNSRWTFYKLKKLFKISFILLFINLIVSCTTKTVSLQFEKEVMYEIYPDLIDSVWVSASYRFSPPPPSHIEITPEYNIEQKKESKKRFNEELAHFKKSGFIVNLVVLDKVTKIKENQKELKEHFRDVVLSENSVSDTLEYKIDRKRIDSYTIFKLRYLSLIPRKGERLYYNEFGYSIRGILYFSRIQFDSEKKYGVLIAGINCGDGCEKGFRVYIKKIKNKWIVDKIEEAWIA
jgi:hypothetical protein